GGIDQITVKLHEPVQEFLNELAVAIAAPVRRGDEDHSRDAGQGLEEQIGPQQFAGFFVNLQVVNVRLGNEVPQFVAGVSRRELRQQTALAVTDDDHLSQGRVFPVRIKRFNQAGQVIA